MAFCASLANFIFFVYSLCVRFAAVTHEAGIVSPAVRDTCTFEDLPAARERLFHRSAHARY